MLFGEGSHINKNENLEWHSHVAFAHLAQQADACYAHNSMSSNIVVIGAILLHSSSVTLSYFLKHKDSPDPGSISFLLTLTLFLFPL